MGRPGRAGRHRRLPRLVSASRQRGRPRSAPTSSAPPPASSPVRSPCSRRWSWSAPWSTSVEAQVPALAAPGDEQRPARGGPALLPRGGLRRRQVYARAAEARGAWDARLEALVVDALLRGEADDALRSRAAALGWGGSDQVTVVVGQHAAGARAATSWARCGGRAPGCGADALVGVQGDRHGGRARAAGTTRSRPRGRLWPAVRGRARWSSGPVVPTARRAGRSARAALAGLVAARAWPEAPRPVLADDLLPERVLSRRRARPAGPWWTGSTGRLAEADPALLDTVAAYLEAGRSVEGGRPAAVRAPQHRPLPAAPAPPRSRAGTRRTPGRASCCRSRSPAGRPGRPAPRPAARTPTQFVGSSKSPARRFVPRRPCCATGRGGRLSRCSSSSCPGQGSQTPGFLAPWLEVPGVAERLRWLSAVAGIDLVTHGTTSDAETIRDTAVAQPLIVAAGLVALPALLPEASAPDDASARRRRRRALRRGADRRRAGRRADRRAGDRPGPRARPRHGRGQRGDADGHERGARGEPGGGGGGPRGARADRGEQERAPGRSSPPARSSSSPRWRPPRRPQARIVPLQVAGAFHTAHMAPAVDVLAGYARAITRADPRIQLLSNADGAVVDDGREALRRIVDQVSSPVRWDACSATLARPRRHRPARAARRPARWPGSPSARCPASRSSP